MRKILFAITIFFSSVTLFVIDACKKETCPTPCEVCEAIPSDNIRLYYKNKEEQEESPCFNPNGGNEFVYIKIKGKKNSLMKYNLIEQKSSVILSDISIIVSQPQWGENGWIVFSTIDWKLNIVKPDGTGYKKITVGLESYLHPVWKNDSTIAAELRYPSKIPYDYAEVDVKGKLKDTLRTYGFDLGTINSKGEAAYIMYTSYPNISVREGKNAKELVHAPISGEQSKRITGIVWHPNDKDIYYTRFVCGIYKINKTTMKDQRIKLGCETRQYRDISVSSDGKKILVQRIDESDYIDTGTITLDAGIYIMDIDGSNERKIEL